MNLSDIARYPSGVVGQVITSSMYSSTTGWQTPLTASDWVLWGTLQAYFMVGSQRQGDANLVRASGQLPGCLVILEPTLASSPSNISVGIRMTFLKDFWSSFRSSTKSWSYRGQTVVAFWSIVSPRHVFFFFSSFFLWSELPNRSDHTGAGEQLPPPSLAGCPRRTEEDLKIGAYLYTFSKRG